MGVANNVKYRHTRKMLSSSLLPGTGGICSTCLGDHFTVLRLKKLTLPNKGNKIPWHQETANLMYIYTYIYTYYFPLLCNS